MDEDHVGTDAADEAGAGDGVDAVDGAVGLPETETADAPEVGATAGPAWMATQPAAPDFTAPVVAASTAAPRRRRVVLTAGAVAVVAVAAIGVAVGTSGSTATPPAGPPTTVVLDAIHSTLGAKTADLHLTMSMQLPGAGTVTASGDGQEDFSNNASEIAVSYHGLPAVEGFQITARNTGGTMYMSMPQISQLVPGKSWVSATVAGASSLAPGSSNPADMLQVLANQGDVVTPLGTSDVDGATVSGYHVVIPAAVLQRRLHQADLPAGVAQSAASVFGSGGLSMDLYVDTSGMLRRLTMDMHLTVSGRSITAIVTEDTSNFGVPVSITAPPADQVMSLQDFEQVAMSATGSPSSS